MMANCKNYTEQGGAVTHFGGTVIFEDGCEVKGLPGSSVAENQTDSTATTVAALKEDLNALLTKLKTAGIMAADTEESIEETPTEETPTEDTTQ